MAQWLRSQCEVYNYRTSSFNLSTGVKWWFKNRELDKDHQEKFLIEDNALEQIRLGNKFKRCECEQIEVKVKTKDQNKNENRIWRRLSMQSYRKQKQRRQEEKSKPKIASVMRTYDKGGLQKYPSAEWL